MNDRTITPGEDLSAAHEALRAMAERRECGQVLRDLAAAESRLGETSFRLVVLGEYKRGKSTLINALLGAPVLPMAVVPLTSVITEVAFGTEPGATIEFLDGRRETVVLDALPDFVTESGNPRNAKRVRRATVHHPAPLLREGVIIVDTPGVGSIFEHNTDATYAFLDEADAVVIVLAVDQPLSAEEQRLTRALAGITERILFVVNRVDALAPDDVATSVAFVRHTLETLEGRPPDHVFALSARQALEARARSAAAPDAFADFERSLHRVLVERKSDILLDRARLLTGRAADLLILELEAERRALGLEHAQLAQAIERLAEATGRTTDELRQSGVLLRHQVERIHSVTLREQADRTRETLLAALAPRVEEALRDGRTRPLSPLAHELSASIGTWVVEEMRRHYTASEDVVRHALDRALEDHASRVQASAGEIVALANDLLGMRARVPEVIAPLPEKPRFYFKDWDYSGSPLRMPGWMLRLPRRWAEPRARSALHELLQRRVGQNLEAIRYDWRMRLDDAVRRFEKSSAEQLDGVARLITEALARAERRGSDGSAEAQRAALERELAGAASLRDRVRRAPEPAGGANGP